MKSDTWQGVTYRQIAERLKYSESHISNTSRLLKLTTGVKEGCKTHVIYKDELVRLIDHLISKRASGKKVLLAKRWLFELNHPQAAIELLTKSRLDLHASVKEEMHENAKSKARVVEIKQRLRRTTFERNIALTFWTYLCIILIASILFKW